MKKTVLLAFCSALIIPEKTALYGGFSAVFLGGVMPKHTYIITKEKDYSPLRSSLFFRDVTPGHR